jgi:3-oxoacyl-[acyl-carrier protein] reductase
MTRGLPLSGKRAIVTGGASGIGRATMNALAESGAKVVGLDRAPPAHSPHSFVEADLASEDHVKAAVALAIDRLGGLDILVNNAGIGRPGSLASLETADLDTLLAVNLRGAILVAREALKALGDGGRIINLSSELAFLGRQNASVYVATKAAMLGLTRSWARELAPGILVNAVAPGPTDTPLLAFDAMTDSEKALELAHPLGRLGKPAEVAAAILFLAGPGASFITGQCIRVDGGASMS